jgi:Tol biopolymer transport system component
MRDRQKMPVGQIVLLLAVIIIMLLVLVTRPKPPETQSLAFVAASGQYSGALFRVDADGSHLQQLAERVRRWSPPNWSPDGGKLLYISDEGYLWVMDADGNNQRRLTQDVNQPAWSPDGSQIAAVIDNNIVVMNLDGSVLRHITNQQGQEYGYADPSWSPDGKYITFEGYHRPSANNDIYIVDALCADADACVNLSPIDSGADEHSYAWSPDSQSIVFASTQQGLFGLFIMNWGSGEIERLTSDDTLYIVAPKWSADGKKIIYPSSNRDGGETFVNLLNVGDSQSWTLPAESVYELSWSPDSQFFAYGVGQTVYIQSAVNMDVNSSFDVPNIDPQTITWRP